MIGNKHLIAAGAMVVSVFLLGFLLISSLKGPRQELAPGQFATSAPVYAPPPSVPMRLPLPKRASVYDVMLDTLQSAGLDHDQADAAADKLANAVDRAVDAKVSAALSTQRAFFPWLAGAVGLTFIVAMIGALRRGAAASRPESITPLTRHEIDTLGVQIEDWAGSETRPAELVRVMLNLGWSPPPVHRGYPPSPTPLLRRVK